MEQSKPDATVTTLPVKPKDAFVPLTGNPENGDYADWYRHLQEQKKEGTVIPFRK